MVDYDITEIVKELEFWEKNKFDICFNRIVPKEIPNETSKEFFLKFREERDFYLLAQRIAYLKSVFRSENKI